jgi:hypothetical protein
MARFILIDDDSGYAFGDFTTSLANASEALIEAARATDANIGAPAREYAVHHARPSGQVTGYHVYRVDVNGSEVVGSLVDGQDREYIDAVTSQGVHVGFVECLAPVEV